jgi:hypothetical protein
VKVAELITMLQELSPDDDIYITGFDSGGYDAINCPVARIITYEEEGDYARPPYLLLTGGGDESFDFDREKLWREYVAQFNPHHSNQSP